MKSKRLLVASIIQVVIGILSIIAFIILTINKIELYRWIVTLLLALAFVIIGTIGIIDYLKKK